MQLMRWGISLVIPYHVPNYIDFIYVLRHFESVIKNVGLKIGFDGRSKADVIYRSNCDKEEKAPFLSWLGTCFLVCFIDL